MRSRPAACSLACISIVKIRQGMMLSALEPCAARHRQRIDVDPNIAAINSLILMLLWWLHALLHGT